MKRPLVSIVIPVYKIAEPYLRQCIQSCMDQTLKNIEIILVDDGSPDNSGRVCDEYEVVDKRIKVVHKENGGLAAARNSGVSQVTGETMMFLDGDDFLNPETCETAYAALINENVQIVLFDQQLVYRNSVKLTPVCYKEPESFRSNQECRILQARVLDFNGWMATATSKLVRVSYLQKYKVCHEEELKQGIEGFIYNIRLFENAESAYYIHKPFYNYVYNHTSITHTPKIENNVLIIQGLEYLDEYGKNHSVIPAYQENLLNRVLYAVITTAIQGVFNPVNNMSYAKQVQWFSDYMNYPLVKRALATASRKGMDRQRKVVLYFIEHREFMILRGFGYLRNRQLHGR